MSDIEPGAMLGQYRIVEVLGIGGMATVFKGHHAALDRMVAIKVLPSRYAADPAFLARFRQEARTVARMRHPNILDVYDFGEEPQGVTYIVNAYMQGGTLDSRLGGAVPPQLAVRWASQIGSGLDYAHARGILHRDLKPTNLFISADDEIVIGDFGLAKILEGTSGLTEIGTVLGTPEYMSPEQALGKELGIATDIYGFGVILYVALVGKVPFARGSALATMLAHVHDPLPSPREANPTLSVGIEEVLTRALAKDPDQRFKSAGELARALETEVATRGTLFSIAGPVAVGQPTMGPRLSPQIVAEPKTLPPPLRASSAVVGGEASIAPSPVVPAAPQRRGLRRVAVGTAIVALVALGAIGGIALNRGGGSDTSRQSPAVLAPPSLEARPAAQVASPSVPAPVPTQPVEAPTGEVVRVQAPAPEPEEAIVEAEIVEPAPVVVPSPVTAPAPPRAPTATVRPVAAPPAPAAIEPPAPAAAEAGPPAGREPALAPIAPGGVFVLPMGDAASDSAPAVAPPAPREVPAPAPAAREEPAQAPAPPGVLVLPMGATPASPPR